MHLRRFWGEVSECRWIILKSNQERIMNQMKNQKVNRIFTNRISIFIVLIILVITPFIIQVYSTNMVRKIEIGIVLTEDDLLNDGATAMKALNGFHGIFKAVILDERFNESGVRTKDDIYLTDDYFDAPFGDEIRDKHEVDIILILTNQSINNWLGNRRARWGQANTVHAMAVATSLNFRNDTETHKIYIQHVAVHEVLHILGYEHPTSSKPCIMNYGTFEPELCSEEMTELHLRAKLWTVGNDLEAGQAFFLIKFIISIIFVSIIIAIMIVIKLGFKRFGYKDKKMNSNAFIFGVGLLFAHITLASAFALTIYLRILVFVISIFIYVIIEIWYFERINRKK
jgi:hypothetical protein